MDVVVTGIGLVSALGELESTWKRLLASKSGIAYRQPFPELPSRPIAMIGSRPAEIRQLTRQVVANALHDANLQPPLLDCAVVIGSSRGNQVEWERLAQKMLYETTGNIGPTQQVNGSYQAVVSKAIESVAWLDTLPHIAAITAARSIGTTAAVLSPMSACATGLSALAQGYELISSGLYQRVIAGAIETPITPLTLTGFDQMGALSHTGSYPFDVNRAGLVLGEGGAVFVLESATLAEQRSSKKYGRILGFGLTVDGYHMSAPEPESRAAITAIQHCLQRSNLSPAAIDYIHAHGTATQRNDENEARLIQQLFSARPAISSTKGATGHTIGASGVIGSAFCLLALQQQLLPPCVGLQHPEFDLNFVTEASPATISHNLCLSFGFGGQNAAIAFASS